MSPETISIIGTIAGLIVGIIVGSIIGYYKSRADAAEQRAKDAEKYVKKDDCIRCAEQREEVQKKVDDRINEGSKMFAVLQTGQAVVLEKLDGMEKQILKLMK